MDQVLGEHGIPKDSRAGRRYQQADPQRVKALRRSRYPGDQRFREELLERMESQWAEPRGAQERQQSDLRRAENPIGEALARAPWDEESLRQTRQGDPVKLRLAAHLRRESPMTLKWIGGRLHMGTRRNLHERL